MPEPAVVLRLSGSGRADRIEASVRGLGRVRSGERALHLPSAEVPVDLEAWCAAAEVRILSDHDLPASPDVLLLARADDLPAPGAIRALVEAAFHSSVAHRARLLPCGVLVSNDGPAGPPPASCVAVPRGLVHVVASAGAPDEAIALLTTAGLEVRLVDAAATFVDAWPDTASGRSTVRRSTRAAYGHPAALPSTSVHRLMARAGLTPPDATMAPDGPFLTVVTRTQGVRPLMLAETLTCLAGQSTRDFDLLLACHRATPEARRVVHDIVGQMPPWLQQRTRVIDVDRPGRAAPLNDSLDVARGRYVAVLDDDDTVTADWVAEFAELEVQHEGTVLHASALRQDVEPLSGPDDRDVVPLEVGPTLPGWSRGFSLVDHIWDNASPFMTLAFPRGVFADLGLRFDESLDAMEDWDYLLRAATLVGVTSSSHPTSVYRTWTHTDGSRQVHDERAWEAAKQSVVAHLDELPLVMPPGTVRQVRALHQALHDERAEKFHFASLNEQAAADLQTVNEAVVVLRARVAQLEERLERIKRRRQST